MDRDVVITGASGFLGKKLALVLSDAGYNVIPARRVDRAPGQIGEWNTETGEIFLKNSPYAIINLAGRSIVGSRWTKQEKVKLRESRVETTTALVTFLGQNSLIPKVWIGASGTGIYGDNGAEVIDENSETANTFLGDLAAQWEAAGKDVLLDAGTRCVSLRFPMILGKGGGAWQKMKLPFSLGLGGNLGTGSQWWSWVHVDDVVKIIEFVLAKNEIEGPLNVTAPNPVLNKQFTLEVKHAMKRPAFIHMPGFLVKLIFGEMGVEIFLSSQRCYPKALLDYGYSFKFPELKQAIESLVHKSDD